MTDRMATADTNVDCKDTEANGLTTYGRKLNFAVFSSLLAD